MTRHMLSIAQCLWLVACANTRQVADPPVPVVAMPAPEASRSYIADPRAQRPGDVLTVVITESSTFQQVARTQANKSQSLGGSVQHGSNDRQGQAALDSKYDGGGRIERTERLLARLTVGVESIDAGGLMTISGEQDIVINGERQHLMLRGRVRSIDVEADNSVQSWKVNGAQIQLGGRGYLSRKQSPGIVQQLLSYFGV